MLLRFNQSAYRQNRSAEVHGLARLLSGTNLGPKNRFYNQLSPQIDDCHQFFEGQRAKLASLEAALSEADRSAQQQMGLLPLSPSRVVPAGAQPMAVS